MEYTLGKRFATLVHDCVAHPLIWLTRDATFAWRLHDWAGAKMLDGNPIAICALSIHNPGDVMQAAAILRDHGFQVGCSPWAGHGFSKPEPEPEPETVPHIYAREAVPGDTVVCGKKWRVVTDTDGEPDGGWDLCLGFQDGTSWNFNYNSRLRIKA